jgi:hypothetical protein
MKTRFALFAVAALSVGFISAAAAQRTEPGAPDRLIGGTGRDRTDDLFHAIIGVMGQIIDGTVLTSRHNRQN